jgi:hypothetical protein
VHAHMTKLTGTLRDCAHALSQDVRKCYSEVLYYGSRGMEKAGCKCGLNKGQFSGHGLILNLTY